MVRVFLGHVPVRRFSAFEVGIPEIEFPFWEQRVYFRTSENHFREFETHVRFEIFFSTLGVLKKSWCLRLDHRHKRKFSILLIRRLTSLLGELRILLNRKQPPNKENYNSPNKEYFADLLIRRILKYSILGGCFLLRRIHNSPY